MNKPWKLIWMVTASLCLVYYVVKTFLLQEPSNTADTFIMMYGLLSLVVYLYFFNKRK